MCYVAARMCGSMNDELEGFRRILLKRCVGSFGLMQHISECLQYLFDDI